MLLVRLRRQPHLNRGGRTMNKGSEKLQKRALPASLELHLFPSSFQDESYQTGNFCLLKPCHSIPRAMSPIASRAKKCAGLFEDLVELLRQPDHQACEISDTEATDAFGRFKIWAGNIGAFQQIDLKSSLDYRLRDAAKISTQILENLDDLTESLEDGRILRPCS